MNTKEVVSAMRSGSTLHMGYRDGGEMEFWLDGGRYISPRVGKNVLRQEGVSAKHDALLPGMRQQSYYIREQTQ